jgi:hypothetical protein
MINTPTAPNRRPASHASDKNGKGAVALGTTLGITAAISIGKDVGALKQRKEQNEGRACDDQDQGAMPPVDLRSILRDGSRTERCIVHSCERARIFQA